MVSEEQRMEQIRMLQDALQERNDELKRVRDQRDEARREVCRSRASCIKDKRPEEIEAALEWDCFKEKTND